jgi:uncharacterized membrane protein YbhN (UPF0104 family)
MTAGLAFFTGAYALAWVTGFMIMFAPAGLGAREATLSALLAGQIGTPEAITVALLSRLVTTAADLLAAAATLLLTKR